MNTSGLQFRAAALALAVGLALSGAARAQPAPGSPGDRLYAAAAQSLSNGRYAEAYGRFTRLADAGHVAAAAVALWMYENGPNRFGADWDVSPDQLDEWTQLTARPPIVMVARSYRNTALAQPRAQSRARP